MILAIVQARMKSRRLPGKVMKRVLGKPLIGHLLERLSHSQKIDKIILATSSDSSNDALCKYVTELGFDAYRGSENDVLDRYYQSARLYGASTIIRVTGDSPLIDPKVVDKVIQYFQFNSFDYVSNSCPPTYPDGQDTEVFSFDALEKSWQVAKKLSDREHVTPVMVQSGQFNVGNVIHSTDLSQERWTLDEEADFMLIRDIFEHLYPLKRDFDLSDILKYKKENPDIFLINRSIKRNEGYQWSLEHDHEI